MRTATMPHQYARTYYGDRWLIIMALLLISFGLVMMTSASVEIASRNFDDPFHFLKRQLMFLALGLSCGAVVLTVPMRLWYRNSVVALFLAYLLLILVLVPGIGYQVNGSTRWFRIGPMSLQASEPAKFLILVFMAWFLSRYHDMVRHSFRGFLIPLGFLALPALLLLMEPDFGALVVLCIAVFGMLFLAGVRLVPFVGSGLLLVGAAVLVIMSSEYRMQRVMSFLQSLQDPFSEEVVYGAGYQLAQALIGFGRGEWFGVGLGNSIQKMYFLPEAHNDFILAIIAEELGVVAVVLLLLLFFAFICRMVVIARRNERKGLLFASYLAYGIAFLFFGQVLINAAVNTGLLPTKGLTLPLLSAGGSSLMTCIVMLAVLLRIDIEYHRMSLPRSGVRDL